jgi:transposase
MTNRQFTEEFKEEAVKQIKERGYRVREVSERLGVSTYSLYKWLKQFRGNSGRHGKDHEEALHKENLRLKNELKRVEEERDILKKAAAYFAKASG